MFILVIINLHLAFSTKPIPRAERFYYHPTSECFVYVVLFLLFFFAFIYIFLTSGGRL